MKPQWFSTKIRQVCLIELEGADLYWDSIFVFQAEDFDKAFQKALCLGKKQEVEYVNANGGKVRWKFKEIISLDMIRQENLDEAEIYSESIDIPIKEREAFDSVFYPENSKPIQTI